MEDSRARLADFLTFSLLVFCLSNARVELSENPLRRASLLLSRLVQAGEEIRPGAHAVLVAVEILLKKSTRITSNEHTSFIHSPPVIHRAPLVFPKLEPVLKMIRRESGKKFNALLAQRVIVVFFV